jgi:hypothetical protein
VANVLASTMWILWRSCFIIVSLDGKHSTATPTRLAST